jgi:nucleoside-diphosphate-sugar epimerase
MRTFITGGTGLIGTAVVHELIQHGHQVLGLARSQESAEKLTAAGAQPIRGRLADRDVLRAAAADSDGVIHLAFSNDFSSPETLAAGIAEEAAALEAIGQALTGTKRPLVTCAGTPVVAGRPATETDPLPVGGPVAGRSAAVTAALRMADQGVRASAVRLPRTVHNNGTGGFAGLLTNIARSNGVATYPGDGTQRWPAVHAADAASLFRLALEKAPAGTSWHAVDDEGDPVRDIVGVIGRRLDIPVASVAAEAFGPLGQIFLADQPASSTITRQQLGWAPTGPKLLADLENIRP